MIGNPKLHRKSNYTMSLIRGMKKFSNSVEVTLYASFYETFSSHYVKKVWSPFFFPIQILRQILADKPDVLHIQYSMDIFGKFSSNLLVLILFMLLKFFKVNLVVTIQSVFPWTIIDKDFVENILNIRKAKLLTVYLIKANLIPLYRIIGKCASLITVWGYHIKSLLTYFYKVDPQKIYVIPHGVDKPIFNSTCSRIQSIDFKEDIILYFGNITPRKDIKTLICAFKKVAMICPNVKLIIAGETPKRYIKYSEELKTLVKNLDLLDKVVFLGRINDDEIHYVYRIAKLVVFPYKYAVEGPSGPLSFAITYCIPVVASDVGYCREAVSHMKEGILYPSGNIEKLAEAIIQLLKDRDLRKKIINNLATKAKARYWEVIAGDTIKVYKKVLRKK